MNAQAIGNGLHDRGDGVIEVSGRITFQTVPEFVARTNAWLHGDSEAITLDLGQVSLIDSAGVALMLEWMTQARGRKRELRFANLTQQVRHLIAVNGLGEAFGLGKEKPAVQRKVAKKTRKTKKG